MMSHLDHQSLMRCRDGVLAALVEAARDRRDGWAEHERDAMVIAANYYALSNPGLTTITADDIERIEGLAVGHVDYADKIALYVAEMVHGVREVRF